MTSFDRLVLAVVAAILLLTGTIVALGNRAGVPIKGVLPANGSTPPSTTPIAITFGQIMDSESVESRFHIEPTVDGKFSWDGTTVSFLPASLLEAGKTYTVRLEAGAATQNGRQTQQDFTWSFAPREAQIVYLGPVDSPVQSLWRVSPDGTNATQLFAPENGIYDFNVSRSGDKIAVSVFTKDLTSDIWVVNLDGSDAVVLIKCAPDSCAGPAWSPDGKLLAYEREEGAVTGSIGASRVWLYDVETGQTDAVYQDNQVLGFSPRWGNDGARLAFFDANTHGIRVVPVAGGDSAVLPSEMGEVGSFSPDSIKMVYTDIRNVGQQFFPQLWLADFSSNGGIQPVLNDAEEDQSPAWSPDGKWIVFARRNLDRSGGMASQMMLYDVENGSLRTLTDQPEMNNTRFVWSPDGKAILVQRFALNVTGGTSELWVYRMDDGSMTKIVDNGFQGAWLP